MYTVTKYECEICGQQFDDEDEAFRHEFEHTFTPEIQKAIHLYDSKGNPLSFSIDSAEVAFFIKCDTIEAWDALKMLSIDYSGVEFPKVKTEEEKTAEWYYQDGWKSFKSLSDEYNRIKSIFEQKNKGD